MSKTVKISTVETCSASTTASNSARTDKSTILVHEVMCDWMSFRHDFAVDSRPKAINSGKTLKITKDGLIEWEKQDFTEIRCASSDTSVRMKCDGHRLYFSGNIGRFNQLDNLRGITVQDCFDKSLEIIGRIYPHIDLTDFGKIHRKGKAREFGTYLTRLDLTSNYHTDSYSQLSQLMSTRKIGTRLPVLGKYGPTWGYDTKRGQYWKAKLYDKTAEQDGKRTPYANATIARFEVQLGSEYLRQNSLNSLEDWTTHMKTENVIYGKFAEQLFYEQCTAEDWSMYTPSLRQHAVMWRDGIDPKSYLKKSHYYKVRSALLMAGLDISKPCNVLNLTRQVKMITVTQAPTLRRVA